MQTPEENLKAVLDDLDITLVCPICGSNNLYYFRTHLPMPDSNSKEFPLIAVMCRICSNIRLFVETNELPDPD